jgi:hypothetical protein
VPAVRRSKVTSIRWYYGEIIYPRNVWGMYRAMVNQTDLAADTLAGIKSLIREAKGK